MKNPYQPHQQEEYAHWQAGFEAKTETECPYESDDSDFRKLRNVWMKGFKAKTKSTKSETNKPSINLDDVSTEQLEQALLARKSKELEQLLQRKAKLQQTLADLELQIQRLEILCQIKN